MKINCPVGCYLRKPKLGSDQKPVIVRFNRKTGEIDRHGDTVTRLFTVLTDCKNTAN